MLHTEYARKQVADYLQNYFKDQYGLRVKIGSLDYTLLPLLLHGKDVVLSGGKDNTGQSIRSDVDLQMPWRSLWSDHFLIEKLTLTNPSADFGNLPQPQTRSEGGGGTFEIKNVEIRKGSLKYTDWSFQDLAIDGGIDSKGFVIRNLEARLEGARISGSGSFNNYDNPVYSFKHIVSGDAALVGKFAPKLPPLSGEVTVNGTVSGTGANYTATGHAESAALSLASNAPFSMGVDYTVDPANAQAPYRLDVKWDGLSLETARVFAPASPHIASVSRGSIRYSGTFDPWKSSGAYQIELAENNSGGLPLSGTLSGELAGGKLLVQTAKLSTGRSRANISGSLNSGGADLHIDATVPSTADLRLVDSRIARAPGSYTFTGSLSGAYDNLKADGILTAEAPDLSATVSGRYFVHSGSMSLDLQGHGNGGQIDPSVSGTFSFTGHAAGTVDRPLLEASLNAQSLEVSGFKTGDITAALHSDGRSVVVDAQAPLYSSDIHGTYSLRSRNFTIDGNFARLSLADLQSHLPETAAGLTGIVSGRFQATGNAGHPDNLDATLTLEQTTLERNGIQVVVEAGSSAHLKNNAVAVDLKASGLDSALSASGSIPLAETGKMALRLSGRSDLKNLRLVTNTIDASGEVLFDIGVTGARSAPQYSGSIQSSAFDAKLPSAGAEFTQASASALLERGAVSIEAHGLLNGAPADLSGVIPTSAIPGKLRLTVKDFPLPRLDPESGLEGTVSLVVTAEGTGPNLRNWTGAADISPANASIAGTPIETEGPIHLDLGGEWVQIKPLRIKAAGILDLAASGKFNLATKQISAHAETQSDLGFVSRFVPTMEAAGKLDAKITAAGSLSAPQLAGSVRVQDGMLRMQGYPLLLERIQLEADATKDRIKTTKMTASMGGGKITGEGEISLQPGHVGEISLHATATNVGTNYPEGFRSQMNADLNFASRDKDYLLQGSIDILRSAYEENINPQSRVLSALMTQRKALVPEETFSNRIKLQLRVRTVEDLLVENNLSRARAGAQLQITGSAYEPRISGRASIRKGSQLFYRQITYNVDRGDLDFVGKKALEPEVHLSLNAGIQKPGDDKAKQCTITLTADGPLDDAHLTANYTDCNDWLHSEAQLYSFLLTGETDLMGSGAQRRFLQQQLVGLLAGQIFTGVQQKLARSIGLQFEPQFLISEGDPTAQLTLGKQLSDELHVTYALSLSQTTEQTWIGEYDVGRNFSVRFTDHSDGTYTGTVNHRLIFGRGYRENTSKATFSKPTGGVIRDITITNESELTETEIRQALGLHPGETYDFWSVRDRITRLKEEFQKQGYLFPSAETAQEGTLDVTLEVFLSSGGRRRMDFHGYTVDQKELSQYGRWWRDGFSEAAVLQQIADNIRETLWSRGYHRAAVNQTTANTGGETVYSFDVDAGAKFNTADIVFQGVARLRESKLREQLLSFYDSANAMTTEAIHDFPSFKGKLVAIYAERGFLQTQIKTHSITFDPTASRVVAEVSIEEGPQARIEDVALSGVEALPHDLLFSLKLWKGGIYRPLLLPQDETIITDFYEGQGYLKFRMSVDVEKSGTGSGVNLRYTLEPGEVARAAYIRIVGNRTTRLGLIQSRLMIKEGDILTPTTLAEAQNRLYELGVFERVSLESEEMAVAGEYNLTVALTERKNLSVAYGYRYNNDEHSEGEAQFTDSNVFGTAQTATLYGKANSNETLYRFFFQSPFLFGWHWNAFFIGSQDRTDNPFFVTTEFNFQQQTRLGRYFAVSGGIGYKQIHTRFFNPFTGENKDLYTAISRIRALLIFDTRDDALNARRGNFASTEFELAPSFLGSDLTFSKSFTQFFHYQPVSKAVWASGIRIGLAGTQQQETLISSERYFAGGSDTLRGFNINSVGPLNPFTDSYLGGQAVFVLNEEIRFPIYRWIGGVGFYDGGNVYRKVSDLDLTDIRHSAGFGLRVLLPYGLLGRIDLGFNLNPHEGEDRSVFHFTFGQIF